MRVKVLAVGLPEPDLQALSAVAARDDWELRKARTMAEALTNLHVAVIVCESRLPDGDWRRLLEQLESRRRPPRLIVASHLADEALWAEVLNLGGYDVLAEPLLDAEVSRVVPNAVCR